MATFEQRDSGWWQAKVRRNGHAQQSRTFETHTEAKKWARDVESQIDRGIFNPMVEAEATTLAVALDRYEREVTVQKKGAVQERTKIGKLKRHKLASRSMASLKSSDIAALRDEILKEHTASTCLKYLALISHLYTIAAKEWDFGVQNPVRLVSKPRVSLGRKRRFEDGEQAAVWLELKASRNSWIYPLAQLAVECGARQGELLKLEWRNVDIPRRTARLIDTKNGSNRDTPLSNLAAQVLAGLPVDIGGRVFPTTQTAVVQAWKRACARAGVVGLRFHDLRHEAASRLFEKGLDIMEVAAITGHKDLQTLKGYTHLKAEDLAKKLG